MAQVVLVEDDLWLGELYAAVIQKAGLSVSLKGNIQDALDEIDNHRPDVIVLDMLLSGRNGLGLLHELASHPDLNSIPVVICSNAVPPEDTVQMLQQYGVVSVVDKTTSSPKHLLKAIKGAVSASISD